MRSGNSQTSARRSPLARARRPLAALLTGTLVVTLALSGTAAEAQTVESLRARAAQLSDELETLEQRSLTLNEQYLETQEQLAELEEETEQNAAAVEVAKAGLAASKDEAASFLVEAYVGNGAHNPLAVGSTDPNEMVNRQVMLRLLRGDRELVADKMSASQEDLEIRSAELTRSSDALEAKRAEEKAIVDELESSIARQNELLNSTNRELNAAVQAERERREAEAARAAAAREEAARAAAAAQTTTTEAPSANRNGGGSSGSTSSTSSTAPRNSGGSSGSNSGGSSNSSAAPAPAPAPAPPVSGPSSRAGAAIAAAKSRMGTPYRWGGTTTAGFDCSGLMLWAWAQAGVSLPRTSGAQRAATQRISYEQLQPGDLVFSGNPIYHVGMYVGGGQMIHSPRTGDVVKISPVRYMGASSYGRVR